MSIQSIIRKRILIICMFLLVIMPLSLSQSADYTDYHIYEGYPDLNWDITFLRVGYDDEQKEFITLIKFEQEYTTQIRATLVLNLRNSLNGNDLDVDVLPITNWPSTPISHNNQPSYGSLARSLIITPTQTSYTILLRDLPANTKGIALRAGSVGNNEKIITVESLTIEGEIAENECEEQGGTCRCDCLDTEWGGYGRLGCPFGGCGLLWTSSKQCCKPKDLSKQAGAATTTIVTTTTIAEIQVSDQLETTLPGNYIIIKDSNLIFENGNSACQSIGKACSGIKISCHNIGGGEPDWITSNTRDCSSSSSGYSSDCVFAADCFTPMSSDYNNCNSCIGTGFKWCGDIGIGLGDNCLAMSDICEGTLITDIGDCPPIPKVCDGVLGDVNNNGYLDDIDVYMIMEYIIDMFSLGDTDIDWCADYNQDEQITEEDGNLVFANRAKCDDGTLYKGCSANMEKYCTKDGTLVDDCVNCGCKDGDVCNTYHKYCLTPSCTDSDGLDYYNRGDVKYTDEKGLGDKNDKCMPYTDNFLLERYCDGNEYKVDYYECPNGCSSGKCKKTCGSLAGDVNYNGYLDEEDIELTRQIINNEIKKDYCADYNQNERIDSSDIYYITNNLARCSDTTLYDRCSVTNPLFCTTEGNLINDCNTCGCPEGYYDCNEDGSCSLSACEDETLYDECSDDIPLFCSTEGALLNDCSTCGCPEGYYDCNLDGTCSLSICEDGTLYGVCSEVEPKPTFCSTEGVLVNNCNECGCPEGYYDCNEDGSCSLSACEDGTVYGECSTQTISKYCNASGILVDYCSGPDKVVGTEDDCGCPELLECNKENGKCEEMINKKDISRYSEQEAFLISDRNWKDVLPLVPVTTWTGVEECQRGTGTSDNICVYPTLIYHSEDKLTFDFPTSESVEEGSSYGSVYSVNGKSLVRFYLDEESKEEFFELQLDIARVGKDYVDVVLADNQKDYFEKANYNLETIPVNVPNFAGSGEGYELAEEYHTYQSMLEEMNSLSQTYPDIAKVYEIGKSIQNRSILAMKISDNVDTEEEETEILVVGNHHARELMTVEVPIFIINYLLAKYSQDNEIKNIVDNHELWFVPMVNPDGHVIVETSDLWWRKNARDNNGDGIIDANDGVDLNRNYGYTWGYDDRGSSPVPESSSYRGTAAFSEPETKAIRDLVLSHNFKYVLDYHSTGGYILYPWGHIYEPTPDASLFKSIAADFRKFIPMYVAGQISDIMYLSNGDSIDWHYGEQTEKNKIIAFGFELNSHGGYYAPVDYIIPTGEEQLMILLNLTGYPFIQEIQEVVDVDSIIYFIQQYSPGLVSIIGETPQELDDLLIAEPEHGAGLQLNQLKRIAPIDYLSYWQNFEDVVYVEDNYELALLASAYASLINAPLIIQGTGSDTPDVFSNRNVICVGAVIPDGSSCGEEYDINGMQQAYLNKTNTTKIILTNPDDLDIYGQDILRPDKTPETIHELYSKTSLAAPILASAKHELIVPDKTNYFENVDTNINYFFENNYYGSFSSCTYSEDCSSGFENNPVDMLGVTNSITFFLSGKSDLTIEHQYYPSVFVNNLNKIDVRIRNIGFSVAENTVLEVYKINDSAASSGGGGGVIPQDDVPVPPFSSYSRQFIFIDRVEVGSILEDETKTVQFEWTPTKIERASLWLNVSTSSNESNVQNNHRTTAISVIGPQPNLKINTEHPSKIGIDSVNKFNVSVSNIGILAAGEFNVEFYENRWDCNPEGCSQSLNLIDSVTIDSLDVDEIKEIVFEFTPAEEGWYDFLVKAELEEDSNPANNENRFSVKAVTSEPHIYYYWDISYPVLVNKGSTINLTLWNDGLEAAQNAVVDFYIREPYAANYELAESRDIGDINEQRQKFSFDWVPVQIGQYYLLFNVSYEHSKGRGNKEIRLYRQARLPGADIGVWIDAKDVEINQENKVEIYIENEGTETARNINYSFYDNNVLIKKESISSLDPNEYREIEVYWTPEGIGAHELKVHVECDNDVNLENNEHIRTIQAYKLKDVVFEIINNSADYVPRYLGIAYNWGSPETIDLVTEPALFTIPDIKTDLWIIKSENMIDENTEYVISIFRNSDLHGNMFVISEDYKNVREEEGKRLYRIYVNEVFWNYESADIRFFYPDYHELGVESLDNLTIFYCLNWDFDYEICLSGWEEANWVDKYNQVTSLYMRTNVYRGAEAFAIGEPILDTSKTEFRYTDEFDFSKIAEEYQNKQKFSEAMSVIGSSNYRVRIPGFFYNCDEASTTVDVLFNQESVGTEIADCYHSLPIQNAEEPLGRYYYQGVRNITLNFNADLVFYYQDKLIIVDKDWNLHYFGENDSTGVETIQVASFGSADESEFYFENEDYSYFVVNAESGAGSLSDLDVYINNEFVGDIDLSNSNGKKGRGFDIPAEMLEETSFIVNLKSKNPGPVYLADVRMKSNFDPYYLTIFASPDAIPVRDNSNDEADFRHYGDLDGDTEGEFSTGRIMGITLSDVSSYLARILFYNQIDRATGATIMMVGDYYDQGIPRYQCGTGFCECYFDVECDELFSRYEEFFDPFVTCNQDLIDGVPQPSGTSDCEDLSRLHSSMFDDSSLSVYADHGSASSWSEIIRARRLENLAPQFGYSFACATCDYGNVKARLFCTNMIRRGAIGYIGAVDNIYGHHFLDEFLDEILINHNSIGYAFKIGKNKEARLDWKTKKTPGTYGQQDILVGDPTFDGGIGK